MWLQSRDSRTPGKIEGVACDYIKFHFQLSSCVKRLWFTCHWPRSASRSGAEECRRYGAVLGVQQLRNGWLGIIYTQLDIGEYKFYQLVAYVLLYKKFSLATMNLRVVLDNVKDCCIATLVFALFNYELFSWQRCVMQGLDYRSMHK